MPVVSWTRMTRKRSATTSTTFIHANSNRKRRSAGRDAYEIRKLMVHSTIKTTRAYVHPRAMRLGEAAEAVKAVSSNRGHSADTRKTGTDD